MTQKYSGTFKLVNARYLNKYDAKNLKIFFYQALDTQGLFFT